jgi:hypothetical protein
MKEHNRMLPAALALALLAALSSCAPASEAGFESIVPADSIMVVRADRPSEAFESLGPYLKKAGLGMLLGGKDPAKAVFSLAGIEKEFGLGYEDIDLSRPAGAFLLPGDSPDAPKMCVAFALAKGRDGEKKLKEGKAKDLLELSGDYAIIRSEGAPIGYPLGARARKSVAPGASRAIELEFDVKRVRELYPEAFAELSELDLSEFSNGADGEYLEETMAWVREMIEEMSMVRFSLEATDAELSLDFGVSFSGGAIAKALSDARPGSKVAADLRYAPEDSLFACSWDFDASAFGPWIENGAKAIEALGSGEDGDMAALFREAAAIYRDFYAAIGSRAAMGVSFALDSAKLANGDFANGLDVDLSGSFEVADEARFSSFRERLFSNAALGDLIAEELADSGLSIGVKVADIAAGGVAASSYVLDFDVIDPAALGASEVDPKMVELVVDSLAQKYPLHFAIKDGRAWFSVGAEAKFGNLVSGGAADASFAAKRRDALERIPSDANFIYFLDVSTLISKVQGAMGIKSPVEAGAEAWAWARVAGGSMSLTIRLSPETFSVIARTMMSGIF